jgi:hypothetical protein
MATFDILSASHHPPEYQLSQNLCAYRGLLWPLLLQQDMVTSSARAVLPPRTIEKPASPRHIMLSQTIHQHHVSAARPGETSGPSRVPRISLNPRPVFKDVRNILPLTPQVPGLSRRPPTRWISKQPEAQLRPPSLKLRHPSSPTSATSFSQPLTTRRAPPNPPLISKREDASKPSPVTIYGHVRARHKMVSVISPHARIVSTVPPFTSSSTKSCQPPAARSLPASSSLVDSRSFDLLKDSIFDGYYRLSVSLDSLTTVRCLSDDRQEVYEKSRARYRSVHHSHIFSRHDGTSKSAPQTNYTRSPISPIRAGPSLPPAPEHPSKQPRHYPALTSPEACRLPVTQFSPLLAGRTQNKLPSISMLMKDDAIGFPADMLNMLNTLETLATKVKTLEMPERVPKPKGNGCVRENDTREIIMEYRDMPTNNGLAVDKVPLMFNRLEKGKWRSIGPDLQGYADNVFSISVSALFDLCPRRR